MWTFTNVSGIDGRKESEQWLLKEQEKEEGEELDRMEVLVDSEEEREERGVANALLIPAYASQLDIPFRRQGQEQDSPTLYIRNEEGVADSAIGESVNPLLDLTGQIIREHTYPSAFGGFADVWIGMWNKKSGSCKVCSSEILLQNLFLK
jgi:hypothetical protein